MQSKGNGEVLKEIRRMKISKAKKWKSCPEETRKKISESLKGNIIASETRKKISSALKGRSFSDETLNKIREKAIGRLHSPEAKANMSKAAKGRIMSDETKEKLSKISKGRMPTNLTGGGGYSNIKSGHYNINGKSIFFRSKWEANYALYLDFLVSKNEISKWEYEADVFIFEKIKFGTRSYRPDFKIINNNNTEEYHEVKGYFDAKSKTKINRMRIYFPNVKLVLIDEKAYKELLKYQKLFKFY